MYGSVNSHITEINEYYAEEIMSREFLLPGRIISGQNAVKSAVSHIAGLGRCALIVTGKTVVTLKPFQSLIKELEDAGVQYRIFTGITGEPTDVMIKEGLEEYRAGGCDFLIGIGGGSPIDSMKAIAVLKVCGGKLAEYMGKEIKGKMPPMVAIPTTAGTGSEATKFTVITDTKSNVKMLLKGDALIPDIAVVDPEYTMTSPKSITASTGLDALTHAVESYTSKQAQPLTDSVALSAIKRVFGNLISAYEDGTSFEARAQMAIAALEAGIAINNASVTLVHGMSRPIGALFHVPHGLSNAMLLEKCMEFAKDGAVLEFAELGRATGAADISDNDEKAADKFIKALGDICRACCVPTLEEYGISGEEFYNMMDKMADDAIASGSPSNTKRSVTKSDVLSIYKSLW